MYHRQYGLIRTLAPLHVGASAGEESGNLNLIFRDAFTQTGIIPGSSIRGRFRAEMRRQDAAARDRRYVRHGAQHSRVLQQSHHAQVIQRGSQTAARERQANLRILSDSNHHKS